MQVSIILEYTKAAPSLTLSGNKTSIRKCIKLALTKRVILFLIVLAIGLSWVWFGQLLVGFLIVFIYSLIFYILQSLDQSLKVDFDFSEADQLSRAIGKDLYYKEEQ